MSVWQIYIPLWFYSNPKFSTAMSGQDFIYIPLWFYSNTNTPAAKITTRIIYIPLWFYSNKYPYFEHHSSSKFTFHYGSILIYQTLLI